MIDLDLRRLRSFVNVAELKSFRRASERLHISPSALSSHIRQLEETLNARLFERTTRIVTLTPEGKRAFRRAQAIIEKFDKILQGVRDTSALQVEQLTVACIPTLVESVIPRVIKVVSQQYPRILLHIIDGGSRDILRFVEEGKANLGIVSVPEKQNPNFEIVPLLDDVFVAVLPKRHPLAQQPSIRFEELARHPFIKFTGSTSLCAAIEHAEKDSEVELSTVLELANYDSVTGLVQAGLGITILPAPTVLRSLRGVVCVPIAAPRMCRHIGVVRRKREALSKSARQFMRVLPSVIKELEAEAMH